MDMIIAAGGGERDVPVDMASLNDYVKGNSSPAFLNERLMNDLRPTLFLTQLSNLLAGNIAIVHGVSGSSRTFMGEEAASIDAARIALARIASGQSDIALIGAAHNGERPDLLILYEFGDYNLKEKFAPVWARFCAGFRRRLSCHRVPGARRSARRQTLRAPDQRGSRSGTTTATRRGCEIP
jgi:3-oxoacyl-[acyl-carrier-protein] synthase II